MGEDNSQSHLSHYNSRIRAENLKIALTVTVVIVALVIFVTIVKVAL